MMLRHNFFLIRSSSIRHRLPKLLISSRSAAVTRWVEEGGGGVEITLSGFVGRR